VTLVWLESTKSESYSIEAPRFLKGVYSFFASVRNLRQGLRVLLSIVLAIILMGILFAFVGFDRVVLAFAQATTNPLFLLLFVSAFLGSFLFRSKRLQLIVGLDEIPYIFFLKILFVSWFLNLIAPARVGEASQIALLHSEHKVPVGHAGTAIVADKIFDLISLVALLSCFLLLIGQSTSVGLPFELFVIIATGAIGVLILGLFLIAKFPNQLKGLLMKIFRRWPRILGIFQNLVDSSNKAIGRIFASKSKILLLFSLSIPVWILEASILFFISQAMGYSFPLIESMTAAIAAFISMTLPLTPGGFGTYELVMAFTLTTLLPQFGLEEVTLPVAIVEHLLREVVTLIAGAISLMSLGIRFSALMDLVRRFRGKQAIEETAQMDSESDAP
jgi:uncharacterized protein (TIRG00374 family)